MLRLRTLGERNPLLRFQNPKAFNLEATPLQLVMGMFHRCRDVVARALVRKIGMAFRLAQVRQQASPALLDISFKRLLLIQAPI